MMPGASVRGLFLLSANSGSLLLLQITELVLGGNVGKLSAMNVIGLSSYQFFAVGCPTDRKCHMFELKPLKLGFCHLESEFPLNLNIKYQRFSASGRLFDLYHFQPIISISCWTHLRVGHKKIVVPLPFGKKGKSVFVARLENLNRGGRNQGKT
jgi:hypothetical protein